MAASFARYDVVRIDHFRGFDEYFCVPAGAPDARDGVWRPGPGKDLFDALRAALGERPVIAEDLGYLTDGVRQLVADCGFPGMKVLEFALTAGFLRRSQLSAPQLHRRLCGLHRHPRQRDGDRLVPKHPAGGAAGGAPLPAPGPRRGGTAVLGLCLHGHGLGGQVVHHSAAGLAGPGQPRRINHPSTLGGNWRWRVTADALTSRLAARIRTVTETYGRCPD